MVLRPKTGETSRLKRERGGGEDGSKETNKPGGTGVAPAADSCAGRDRANRGQVRLLQLRTATGQQGPKSDTRNYRRHFEVRGNPVQFISVHIIIFLLTGAANPGIGNFRHRRRKDPEMRTDPKTNRLEVHPGILKRGCRREK